MLDKACPMRFERHRCGGLLEREEADAGDSAGHAKQSRLMSQLDGLLKMLQQFESQDIPNNDFDTDLSLAVPVRTDANLNPQQPGVPIIAPKAPPVAVKGMMPSQSFGATRFRYRESRQSAFNAPWIH